jgi:hypothetical protein
MKCVIYFLLFYGFVITSSCSKDNVNKEPDLSEVAMKNLTEKYYIRTDAISDPAYPVDNGLSSSDLYHDFYKDPCVLDDLRLFKVNGDFIYDNGATKCDSLERQTATLQWKFIETFSKIEVTILGTKDTLKIIINDGTILKYQVKRRLISNGITNNYIWTETWRVKP